MEVQKERRKAVRNKLEKTNLKVFELDSPIQRIKDLEKL